MTNPSYDLDSMNPAPSPKHEKDQNSDKTTNAPKLNIYDICFVLSLDILFIMMNIRLPVAILATLFLCYKLLWLHDLAKPSEGSSWGMWDM